MKTGSAVKAPTGATAQAIQSQILNSESVIASLNARKGQIKRLMEGERATLENINSVEAEISELTRDYVVNQDMYQSLLSQRENARISMNIDLQNQGLTLKVQEPAFLPLTPKGIRFSHIILAGSILSFLIPIGLVYGFTLIDRKVRTESAVQQAFDIPILASVYTLEAPSSRISKVKKLAIAALIIFSVWAVYGYAIYSRLKG